MRKTVTSPCASSVNLFGFAVDLFENVFQQCIDLLLKNDYKAYKDYQYQHQLNHPHAGFICRKNALMSFKFSLSFCNSIRSFLLLVYLINLFFIQRPARQERQSLPLLLPAKETGELKVSFRLPPPAVWLMFALFKGICHFQAQRSLKLLAPFFRLCSKGQPASYTAAGHSGFQIHKMPDFQKHRFLTGSPSEPFLHIYTASGAPHVPPTGGINSNPFPGTSDTHSCPQKNDKTR